MGSTNSLIVRNASIVARRYKSKCWWASEEDIRQDAIVEQIKCLRTADKTRPLIRYAWRTAVIAASHSVKRASSPVSGSEPDRLVGLHRATRADFDALSERDTPEALLQERQHIEAIRARVRELLGEEGVEFAVDMLTGEFKAADVAVAHGIPVASVYLSVRRIRDVLMGDSELYRMWKD